jgi:uncharacterized membrane protein
MASAPSPDARLHDDAPAPSRAAILGHPIHPMLIPFPLAALTGALLTDLAFWMTGDPFWARASTWLLGFGVLTGLAAGAVGAIDYFGVPRARAVAMGKVHAYGNVVAIVLALVNWILRLGDEVPTVTTTEFVLSLLVAAVLGVTGWAGGELSYRHRVGVTEHA